MSNFAEILRSTQKDETVRTQLTNDFSTNFLLKIFGPRKWLAHKKWIEATCHFLYLSVTTLSDFQTLGEEYTGIAQVVQDSNTKKLNLPSKFKRLVMILIQTFGPEVLKTFLIPKITKNYSPEKVILTEVLDLISKINLLWFYVQGTYYHIAKRFLGIQYAKLRPLSYEDPNLKWIKIISAVNAMILFYQFVMKVRNKLSETRDKGCCIVGDHFLPNMPDYGAIRQFVHRFPSFTPSLHIFVLSGTIFSLSPCFSSKSCRLAQKCAVNGGKEGNL